MKNLLFLIPVVALACGTNNSSSKTSSSSDSTIAADTNTENDNALRRWHEKFQEGTDFMATGNEPFWSVEIDLEKNIFFKTLNGDSIVTPTPEGIRLQDVAATSYRAQTKSGLLNVIIYDMECINDMSGDTLPKKVEVRLESNTYNGCGRFLGDIRLNDIWVLEKINDKTFTAQEFNKGLPMLEFHFARNTVMGHTGCNNFTGTFEVRGSNILFSQMAGTRMACGDMEFENRYLPALMGRMLSYKIENLKLNLYTAGDSVFVYRKVD